MSVAPGWGIQGALMRPRLATYQGVPGTGRIADGQGRLDHQRGAFAKGESVARRRAEKLEPADEAPLDDGRSGMDRRRSLRPLLAARPDLVRMNRARAGFMGDAYGAGDKMNLEGTKSVTPIGVLG